MESKSVFFDSLSVLFEVPGARRAQRPRPELPAGGGARWWVRGEFLQPSFDRGRNRVPKTFPRSPATHSILSKRVLRMLYSIKMYLIPPIYGVSKNVLYVLLE